MNINIPNDATNGDAIMAMFPNAEKEYFSSTDTSIWFKHPMGCRIIFSNHWWYAPYKENKE